MILLDQVYSKLDFLARRHFIFLNPRMDVGNYAESALISSIEEKFYEALANEDECRIDFWSYFLDDDYTNLKRLLIGRPLILAQIIQEINALNTIESFTAIAPNGRTISSAFGTEILKVFNYTNRYRSTQYCHDTYAKLGIASCPYCNEGTAMVQVWTNNGADEEFMNHQLDHFFCQLRYPYMALSFFNLIPCCNPCNSLYKSTTDVDLTNYVNPFDKSIDDNFKFSLSDILINSPSEVVISVSRPTNFPMRAISLFDIENRYRHNTVKRQLFESYIILKGHSPKVNRAIDEQFGITMPLDQLYDESIRRQLFQAPQFTQAILFQQYGKLKRDIFNDLELV